MDRVTVEVVYGTVELLWALARAAEKASAMIEAFILMVED